MSVFAGSALQIWTLEPRVLKSQFHARKSRGYFRFVSPDGPGAKRRGALADMVSRYNAARERSMMQGRHHAIRAILALVLLCTAFSGKAQGQPSADTIARGKALVEAADCASCHSADPSKPFAGGK